MNGLPFIKMHGLGNDFVVLDARKTALNLGAEQVCAISNRRTGVGCDQFIILEPARDALADVFMRILNSDGGEVEACGNATRCIASLMMDELGKDNVIIETVVGLLDAERSQNNLITVDMGRANLDWREIPLSQACDTLTIPLNVGALANPVGVNVGNPHAVFFVEDVATIDLPIVGPKVEHHDMFPERTNVEVVELIGEDRLRMRVWERGVGITQACGTGACATLVAAARRGLTSRKAEVVLDGGSLWIEWLADDHILMTGAVSKAFSGVLDPTLLAKT